VTKRSGKHRECHQRWACNKHLRYAVHLFSEHTITRCAWAEIYYKAHRTKDHSHARALRCLGQRWLKIIHKMWMEPDKAGGGRQMTSWIMERFSLKQKSRAETTPPGSLKTPQN